jgi:hypothetical protein
MGVAMRDFSVGDDVVPIDRSPVAAPPGHERYEVLAIDDESGTFWGKSYQGKRNTFTRTIDMWRKAPDEWIAGVTYNLKPEHQFLNQAATFVVDKTVVDPVDGTLTAFGKVQGVRNGGRAFWSVKTHDMLKYWAPRGEQ